MSSGVLGCGCDSESSSVALPVPEMQTEAAKFVRDIPVSIGRRGSIKRALGRYDATPKFIKKLLAHQAAKAVVYLAGTQPELDGAAAGLLRAIDSARGQRVGPRRDRWARPPKMAGQPAMP